MIIALVWNKFGNGIEVVENEEFNFWKKNNSFKSLALSKIFFLAQALLISNKVISAVEKVQRVFIWHDRSPRKWGIKKSRRQSPKKIYNAHGFRSVMMVAFTNGNWCRSI